MKCRFVSTGPKRSWSSPLPAEVLDDVPSRIMAPMTREPMFAVIIVKDQRHDVKLWTPTERDAEREADGLATGAVVNNAVGTSVYVARILSKRECRLPPPKPLLPELEYTKYR